VTRTNPFLDKSRWEKDERGYVWGDKTMRGDMSRVAKLRRGYVRVAKITEGDLSGRGFVTTLHITISGQVVFRWTCFQAVLVPPTGHLVLSQPPAQLMSLTRL